MIIYNKFRLKTYFRTNHRKDRVNKQEARDKEYEEYVEDADCKVLDCL